MNKDYVRTTSRPPRKRKPTGRSGSAQPTRAPFPVIRAVLAVALVIGFGVFLYLLKGQGNDAAEDTKPKAMAKPIPIEDQRPAKEKFDYMTLLENKEVNVDLPSGATPTDLSIDPEQQKRILAQQAAIEQQRLKAQQQSDLANPAATTTPTGTATSTDTSGAATRPKLSESERAAALLAAYQAVRPLTAAERELLPAMLRAGALRFWLSRLWDFYLPREASMLKPHDPTHFERVLRERVRHPVHP